MEDNKTIVTVESLKDLGDTEYLNLIRQNKVKDILKGIGLFNDQTITNIVLILNQMPNATCVKRMTEWNYYKRNIVKGQKAIKVLAYTLGKFDKDYDPITGVTYAKGIDKLKTEVGYVFDISQTQGENYAYLNSNKETIAQHFDIVKKALEKTVKGYEVSYVNMEENSKVDFENKKIYIKDGISLNLVLKNLFESVTSVLLKERLQEGLTKTDKTNIEEIENNAVVYAIYSKLGLELPNYNFDEISSFNTEELKDFKDNLQKVRSVTKQVLSNVENSIERSVRNLNQNNTIIDTTIEEESKQTQEQEQNNSHDESEVM